MGARRVLVTGTGPMGCVPAELALRSRNGDCDEELQRAASLYNPQLVDMIKGLNQEIGADVFVAANAYQMHMDFISDPQAYGMPSPGLFGPCWSLVIDPCGLFIGSNWACRICYIEDSVLRTRPI